MCFLKLEDFEFVQKIADGHTCKVYKSYSNRLNKLVAIKILDLQFVSNDRTIKKFINEAETVLSLSHPNIVNGIELVRDDNIIGFSMEFIEGENLKELMRKNVGFPLALIKKYFDQLLEAVSYCHKVNLVHGDIKPRNIMITKDDKIKLIDFERSKMITSSTSRDVDIHYMEAILCGLLNRKTPAN